MHGIGVSTVTAYTAHKEWATRPPDERFDSVHALYEAARTRRLRTEERRIDTVDFGTEAVSDDEVALRDPSGRTAALTNWSFEQLATIAGAPPKYLRTLPASIASSAINHGLRRQRREQHQLFTDQAAPWTVHAITSPRREGDIQGSHRQRRFHRAQSQDAERDFGATAQDAEQEVGLGTRHAAHGHTRGRRTSIRSRNKHARSRTARRGITTSILGLASSSSRLSAPLRPRLRRGWRP